MPKTNWDDDETSWLRSQVDLFKQVRTKPPNHQAIDGPTPREQFLRQLVHDLQEKFISRRWTDSLGDRFQSAIEYHAWLYKTLEQWMQNQTRSKAGITKADVQPIKPFCTGRQLAMQEWGGAIKLQAGQPQYAGMGSREAWNRATTAVMAERQQTDPAAVEDLNKRAKDIRESASRNYAEQDPQVLKAILAGFKSKVGITTHEWGRTTGAAIFTIAIMDSADEGIVQFDVCSDNVAAFAQTDICANIRHQFGSYVCDVLGVNLERRPENAELQVYPDRARDHMPMLPDIGDIDNADPAQLKQLLQSYFRQLWMWQGGKGAPPYTAITRDCMANTWAFIDRQRAPEGAAFFQHPTGQCGQLSSNLVFQFAQLLSGDGSILCCYSSLCTVRHPTSRLTWSGEAITYAKKVEGDVLRGNSKFASWCDLPVARTVGVYQPFTSKQRQTIQSLSSGEVDLNSLADLCEEHERLGAAHVIDASDSGSCPHLPTHLLTADIERLFGKAWPHRALFHAMDPVHPQYALSTFVNWLRTCRQLRHSKSGTWVGGPGGVRWLVAILSHFVQALKNIDERKSVPASISDDISLEFHQVNWHLVRELIGWTREELQVSRDVLRTTFSDRAECWKAHVLAVHNAGETYRVGSVIAGAPVVRATTWAVPVETFELHACFQTLQQLDEGAADFVGTQPIPADRSHSAENITLPSFDSDDSISLPNATAVQGGEAFWPGVSENEEGRGVQHDSRPKPTEVQNNADNESDLSSVPVILKDIAVIPTEMLGDHVLSPFGVVDIPPTPLPHDEPGRKARRPKPVASRKHFLQADDSAQKATAENENSDVLATKEATSEATVSKSEIAGSALGFTSNHLLPAEGPSSVDGCDEVQPVLSEQIPQVGDEDNDNVPEPSGDVGTATTSGSIALGSRPKRNAARSERAQLAIKGARKGTYVTKTT